MPIFQKKRKIWKLFIETFGIDEKWIRLTDIQRIDLCVNFLRIFNSKIW